MRKRRGEARRRQGNVVLLLWRWEEKEEAQAEEGKRKEKEVEGFSGSVHREELDGELEKEYLKEEELAKEDNELNEVKDVEPVKGDDRRAPRGFKRQVVILILGEKEVHEKR